MEAQRLMPPSTSARQNAFVALNRRSAERRGLEALKDRRAVLSEAEALQRWDPDSKLWERERAAAQLTVSQGILNCNESKAAACGAVPPLEEAEALTLEAIATCRALAKSDPSSAKGRADLAWALGTYSNVLAARGRHEDQLAMLKKSEEFWKSSKRDDAIRIATSSKLFF